MKGAAFAEFTAPASWQTIDFLSDLHLADDTPRALGVLAAHLRHTPADAVFILGDLFEVWVGDDARHEGSAAACAAMLTEAAAQRTIGFMAGNRDFLVGTEMLAACGIVPLTDPTVLSAFGERILLTHGDALCLADLDYQRFRAEVRSDEWQRNFLAQPLAERRRVARHIRTQSQQHKAAQSPDEWADVDTAAALQWMRRANTPTLIHGHTHRPSSDVMAPGFTRHVLSDWSFDTPNTAVRADVLRWQRSGLTRVAPTPAP